MWLLIRVGQWSFESVTLIAIVPVAVLAGMSEKRSDSLLQKSQQYQSNLYSCVNKLGMVC